MAPNNYAELSAKMREKPTFGVAEEVIKKDFPLKLPNRTFINLWNTPEISQFRGYQDDLDEPEGVDLDQFNLGEGIPID